MTKRVWSLLLALCMAVTLLPITVFAAEPQALQRMTGVSAVQQNAEEKQDSKAAAGYIYVNGTKLTDGMYWRNGNASASSSNYNAYYKSGTLYLKNAKITGGRTVSYDGRNATVGIYVPNGSIGISLSGTNSISNSSYAAVGIYVEYGSLTISGSGILSAGTKKSLGDSDGNDAIVVNDNLTISGTTVSANAGWTGIFCDGTYTIQDAVVSAYGQFDIGTWARTINIKNSRVTVNGCYGMGTTVSTTISGKSLVITRGTGFGDSVPAVGLDSRTNTSGMKTLVGSSEASAYGISNFDSVDHSAYPYVAVYSNTYSGNRFVDVHSSDWFYSPVGYVYNKGLMAGTSAIRFSPNNGMNRAMAAMTLYKMSKLSGFHISTGSPKNFTDVSSGAWYADAVKWASGAGIVSGTGGNRFSPNAAVTREQFAVMLYGYAKKLGWSVSSSASLSGFSDANRVSSWSKDAMKWAVARKIMSGSDGKLMPQGTLTRAQASVMLRQFASLG